MKTLNGYVNYKDSGVEWLEKIPEHWEVKKLKFVTNINPEKLSENTSPDYLIRYLDISNVEEIDGIGENQELFFENAPSRARRIVKDGDTIISTVRTYLKAIAYFDNPPANQIVSTGFAVLRPQKNIYPKFLKWLILSPEFIERVVMHSQGVGYPAINPSELANFPIWIPPFSEQLAIANFLDRKTARIDAMIAKYNRLIELLNEKRLCLINQAVTKGLDASTEMKYSGKHWFGNMPKNWKISRLKNISKVILSSVDKHSHENEESVFLCNYVDVYKNDSIISELGFMKATASAEEIRKFTLKKNDVLITKDSESWKDIAISAFVPEDLDNVLCGYHLALVRPNSQCFDGRYLFYSFQARPINYQLEVEATGITRYGIDQNAIGNVFILCPPLNEQQNIGIFLDQKTAQIDSLKKGIIRMITKLQEYRTTLISETVTGKIDVRN
ncbi:restriction endonuclease subunit S [Leptolinea tardivitalis]|uniref:Type I restriction modification DNA specificity domain-containing protein n=1 Tax=Leptolinea tardivitalis TaxID=229920 RepID=A0A0P6XB72_9CHLR|nr:restriction endonuclease subunit S [Leptolinea tardivitalis]KPL72481.1 hypothetical protein ADM99_04920 [Leptolinea tardivitalis]GAP21237.1 restriction endonuclease S subunits [Leptolinea tardivitalis]